MPANKRNMGIVFQAYSLFPNMTARDNVAYGLRLRGVDEDERRRSGPTRCSSSSGSASRRTATRTRCPAASSSASRSPGRSRSSPRCSSSTSRSRRSTRRSAASCARRSGASRSWSASTTLFVTHDQEEALALGDRVGVMSAGRLEQIAPPAELYDRPATAFVAEFVGLTNRLKGVAGDGDGRGPRDARAAARGLGAVRPVTALVRPEAVRLVAGEDGTARVVARELPRIAVPRPGDPARTRTLVVAQMSATDAKGLHPGASVAVGVVPAPVFAVAE